MLSQSVILGTMSVRALENLFTFSIVLTEVKLVLKHKQPGGISQRL